MTINFFVVVLLLFFAPINLLAKKQTHHKKNKVMCVTIPKTGTHLLMKCITLMGIDGISYEYTERPGGSGLNNLNDKIPKKLIKAFKSNKKALRQHLMYTPEAEIFLNERTFANFFMIRDPRAQLVSQAFTFKRVRIGAAKKSLEDIMLDMILSRKENFLPLKKHFKNPNLPHHILVNIADLFWHIGEYEFYKKFLPWMNAKNFYTVRFENLVGPQGGGTQEAQEQEIRNIAHHLGLILSNEQLKTIVANLYGGTGTFREGKTDSWKQHFTPKVKEAFKNHPGLMQLLIDLGYEKDVNW